MTTATRSEALPDVPTVGEFVPGYEASTWPGIGAPKNTPADIVEQLNKEINAALADPKIKARLADLGGTPLADVAGGLRQIHRRRNREVGQGDPGGQHQGGVSERLSRAYPERDAMKLPRRQFLHLAAGAAALPALSRIARAQAYPSRPVRMIVGFAAGGATDIIARLMGQWLSERLGQPFVIENRPGAGSNIGTEAVVRAPPDGYTLLLVGTANTINATLYDKLNFNFIRDIAPVAGICRVPNVMEVHPSVPAKTVPEFIAYAKANPGKINMASAGSGTAVPCRRRTVQDDDRRRPACTCPIAARRPR